MHGFAIHCEFLNGLVRVIAEGDKDFGEGRCFMKDPGKDFMRRTNHG
jgi:hypothetical protein